MRWLSGICLLAALAPAAVGAEIVVEGDSLRLTLGEDGIARALVERQTGRNWLSPRPVPFASVKKGAVIFPVTSLTPADGVVRARFGGAGAEADLRFVAHANCIVVEVVRVSGTVDSLSFVQLLPDISDNVGQLLNVRWNAAFAVCVMALSERVDGATDAAGVLTAATALALGMAGGSAAIIGVPTPRFPAAVQQVEHEFGLPSPTIGGEWARASQGVRSSYLFTDLTEANADETIRLAKLGGFGAILIYAGTWATTTGSYPINTASFPRGEASLKAVIDKCHAAGLEVGMHMLTSLIAKSDPLVTPRPDPRLLKDGEATLAADIDPKATVIMAREALATFPGQAAVYGVARGGLEAQIDDEIIQYRTIGGPGGRSLLQCIRGFGGTRAAPHRAGARISHLCERLGDYLVDLRTSLKDELAERVAGVFNRCGFGMIYFDGGELNGDLDPGWYWLGRQQMAVFQRIKRDVLVQGSGTTHWLWHIFARETCDDFADVAVREWLDGHKIALWRYYRRNFLPAELGWWGFLSWAPERRATTPDEVELYAARMVALDAPVSVETTVADLHKNGRAEELLRLLGEFERLRLANRVPAALRDAMRLGEWHLTRTGDRWALAPARYQVASVPAPGEVVIANEFAAQPLRFRIEAAPVLSPPGARANIVLLDASRPLALEAAASSALPGALGGRIEVGTGSGEANPFVVGASAGAAPAVAGKARDLVTHRALAVTLDVEGQPAAASEAPPVLNVQLESNAKMYRDYDLDLDWRGERTVVLPEPTPARTMTEFPPSPVNYRLKAAMYAFDYHTIVAVNFRWMRQAKAAPLSCRVLSVEALAEQPGPLVAPTIAIGRARLTVPAVIAVGGYAEYWGHGTVRVFDRDGVEQMEVNPTSDTPSLAPGANRVGFESRGAGRARLTVITLGEPRPL